MHRGWDQPHAIVGDLPPFRLGTGVPWACGIGGFDKPHMGVSNDRYPYRYAVVLLSGRDRHGDRGRDSQRAHLKGGGRKGLGALAAEPLSRRPLPPPAAADFKSIRTGTFYRFASENGPTAARYYSRLTGCSAQKYCMGRARRCVERQRGRARRANGWGLDPAVVLLKTRSCFWKARDRVAMDRHTACQPLLLRSLRLPDEVDEAAAVERHELHAFSGTGC